MLNVSKMLVVLDGNVVGPCYSMTVVLDWKSNKINAVLLMEKETVKATVVFWQDDPAQIWLKRAADGE